jgi:hypothetical protein
VGMKLEMYSPEWSSLSAGNITLGLHPESQYSKVSPTLGLHLRLRSHRYPDRCTAAQIEGRCDDAGANPRRFWMAGHLHRP